MPTNATSTKTVALRGVFCRNDLGVSGTGDALGAIAFPGASTYRVVVRSTTVGETDVALDGVGVGLALVDELEDVLEDAFELDTTFGGTDEDFLTGL